MENNGNKFIVIVHKLEKGIGITEIIITIAIISIAFWGISQIAAKGLSLTNDAKIKMQAVYLAPEGLEAARAVRDESWSSNISSTSIGIDYFPVISGTKWILTGSDPGLINERFTRKVVFGRVYRDANDNIADSGTEDTNTRKVTVSVFWDSGSESYEIITYLTNFLFN